MSCQVQLLIENVFKKLKLPRPAGNVILSNFFPGTEKKYHPKLVGFSEFPKCSESDQFPALVDIQTLQFAAPRCLHRPNPSTPQPEHLQTPSVRRYWDPQKTKKKPIQKTFSSWWLQPIWKTSPNRGENKKSLKTPPSFCGAIMEDKSRGKLKDLASFFCWKNPMVAFPIRGRSLTVTVSHPGWVHHGILVSWLFRIPI